MTPRPFAALTALALIACSPAPGEATEAPASAETTAPSAPAAAGFTPGELTSLIATQGAEGALMDLMVEPEDPRWQTLLGAVSEGDSAWIDAAAPLIPVLDGEAAESLFSALGDALLHQPNQVLIAAGPDAMASVCQPYPPETVQAKIAVLEAIPYEEQPAALRRECLQTLYQEPT